MTHYAVKIAYIGWAFSGSQRQPEVRTVEGDIMRALSGVGAAETPDQCDLRSGGRTDKGVSALGNVVSFHSDMPPQTLFPAMSANLKDIFINAYAQVGYDFNPRRANERWYRYHINDRSHDVEAMARCARLFVGYHDFSRFAKVEKGRNPMRRVNSVVVSRHHDMVTVDVKGESFLWNMVRRIASALHMVGTGECAVEDISRALAGYGDTVFPPLPPEALVLMDVSYDMDFIPLPDCGGLHMLEDMMGGMKTRLLVLETLRKGL